MTQRKKLKTKTVRRGGGSEFKRTIEIFKYASDSACIVFQSNGTLQDHPSASAAVWSTPTCVTRTCKYSVVPVKRRTKAATNTLYSLAFGTITYRDISSPGASWQGSSVHRMEMLSQPPDPVPRCASTARSLL